MRVVQLKYVNLWLEIIEYQHPSHIKIQWKYYSKQQFTIKTEVHILGKIRLLSTNWYNLYNLKNVKNTH